VETSTGALDRRNVVQIVGRRARQQAIAQAASNVSRQRPEVLHRTRGASRATNQRKKLPTMKASSNRWWCSDWSILFDQYSIEIYARGRRLATGWDAKK
jgi:hypothetical protein